MLTYIYTARDTKTGEKITAEIEAENEQAASKLLLSRGLSPLEITQSRVAVNVTGSGFRGKVPAKEKVIFSRQLSTMINAGLPLVQSLNTVLQQSKNKNLKSIVQRVIADVEAGSPLSEALVKYPATFDEVYISLIAAGEASGTLDKSLERLANQQEKDAEVLSKVRGAMIYPAVVLLVLFGVATFMSVKVLPEVVSIYSSIPGAHLPFISRYMLDLSHFTTHYWWIVIALVVGAFFLLRRWLKTPSGIRSYDTVKLRVWPFGQLMSRLYMARFARTSSTLIGSGVPMIKMLGTTSRAVGNSLIADSIDKASEKVKGGKTLAESLKGDPNFLELVPDMVNIGEQSGQLESMMSKVADYYEREVDNQIKAISTIIEPALMIVVGIMALIIVAAVLLPIYQLAGQNLSAGL